MKKSVNEEISDLLTIRANNRRLGALATEIGIPRGTLRNYQEQRSGCTIKSAEKILDALGYELIIKKKDGEKNESLQRHR